MLTLIEKLLFIVAVAASLYFAGVGFYKVYKVIMRGSGEKPSFRDMMSRLWYAAYSWITTRPIWKTRPWSSLFHIMISVGFVFYFLVNFGDIIEALFPVTFLGHNIIGDLYRFFADLATISVLIGVIYFILRRFVFNDKALTYHENVKLVERVKQGGIRRDSLIVAFFILFHVGFRWLGNSFKLSLEGGDAWQPFSTALSQLWLGWGEGARIVGEHLGFWLAIGLILAFLPYFPYTKHFHLIMSGFNFLSKPKRTSLGALEPIDFEDESQQEFGVNKIEQLPWTHLVDAYSCIMCNRCQDVCPAYTTGKELSPAALEINKRYYLNEHLDELAGGKESEFSLIDFAISESAVWACTACGACVDICPVGNEPMFDILYIRRHQVLMENAFPSELKTAYRGMERNGNPWNISARDRMNWAKGLQVPTVDENPDFELLWWVGCAPSYDPRAQDTARALAKVLNAAGLNFAVLGEMERCTGDSARRSGNEALFFELAQGNIETLNEVMGEQKRRIVTTCPHCLHTLGKEYSQYGGNYEVIHHTQLLSELTAAKKISVQRASDVDMITFHDPCYLGRQNGIVEEPRNLLLETNAFLIEMPRHGKQSFCCGAGGAQMWKEEEHGAAPVNMTRYEEAAATGAKTIAVGCPFCLTMMTDASKQADQGLVVKDIAEIIAERLEQTPVTQ
ncbi:MAG: (Fe-S)-binding protein [Caldilinea sp.]